VDEKRAAMLTANEDLEKAAADHAKAATVLTTNMDPEKAGNSKKKNLHDDEEEPMSNWWRCLSCLLRTCF
jgi:hypothetical protein